MRCPSCNKFATLTFEEPEAEDPAIDGTTVTISARIARNSERCGDSAVQLALAEATGAPCRDLAITASVLALSLFKCKAMPCTERVGCLDTEGKRLGGWPLLPRDATMRPWSMFDPAKLCNHCRPYWYAEMAAGELRRCAHFEAEIAADAARKAGK